MTLHLLRVSFKHKVCIFFFLFYFAAQNIGAQIRQEHLLHINAAYDAPLVNISNNNAKLKLSIHPSCAHSASELPKEIHPFVYVSSGDTVFLFE